MSGEKDLGVGINPHKIHAGEDEHGRTGKTKVWRSGPRNPKNLAKESPAEWQVFSPQGKEEPLEAPDRFVAM